MSLDDKKRLPDTALGERGKLEKPWQRDDKPAGRERQPDRPKTPPR